MAMKNENVVEEKFNGNSEEGISHGVKKPCDNSEDGSKEGNANEALGKTRDDDKDGNGVENGGDVKNEKNTDFENEYGYIRGKKNRKRNNRNKKVSFNWGEFENFDIGNFDHKMFGNSKRNM